MGIGWRDLFLRHNAQTTDFSLALEIDRAQGSYLYTPDGKKILDFISGIGVSNCGHSHPAIVEAVKKQVDKYMHLMVYGEVVQQPQVAYAHALVRSLDNGLDSVFFVNSGAEAIEGALKLAKRVSGRSEILSFSQAYHGSTAGALSAMGSEEFKRAFRPLVPGHRIAEYNSLTAIEAIGPHTAAVLVEPIQSESGYQQGTESFLQSLATACKKQGALLIFDEIQCGFGRNGHLWAHQAYNDLVPDILCLGKALGGGMPLGAFIAKNEHMRQLADNPLLGHITTFGGHPVSCAAGLAALELLQSESWISQVLDKGKRLSHALKSFPGVQKVTGVGLLWAVHLPRFESVLSVQKYALERGLLTDWFLFENKALRIAPPLSVSDHELEEGLLILQNALENSISYGYQ